MKNINYQIIDNSDQKMVLDPITKMNKRLLIKSLIKVEVQIMKIRKPFRFMLAIAFILVGFSDTNITSATNIKVSNGVIFSFKGERSFTDSDWVVVSDITFNQPDSVLKELKSWLRDKAKGIENIKASESSKFSVLFQQHVCSRARDNLQKLTTMELKFEDLRQAIHSSASRKKRGIVDGGGKVLSWLFGIATNEELEKVNHRVNQLSTESTMIAHALEDHTSLINETMWEIHANAESLFKLSTTLSTLEREMQRNDLRIGNVLKDFEYTWISTVKADEAFRAVDITMDWLEEYINSLGIGLATIAMERLPPSRRRLLCFLPLSYK